MNKPETKCQLVCQKHFQRIGEYKVICGMDGKWHGEKTGKCVKIEWNIKHMQFFCRFFKLVPRFSDIIVI